MRSKDPKTQVGCVIVDSTTLKVCLNFLRPLSLVITRNGRYQQIHRDFNLKI